MARMHKNATIFLNLIAKMTQLQNLKYYVGSFKRQSSSSKDNFDRLSVRLLYQSIKEVRKILYRSIQRNNMYDLCQSLFNYFTYIWNVCIICLAGLLRLIPRSKINI